MHAVFRSALPLATLLLAAACSDPAADVDGTPGSFDASPVDAAGSPDAWACVASGQTTTLRVATWNVHDLFDENDDSDTNDTILSSSEVEEKLDDIGAVLRSIDADFVLLQEVETADLLQRLLSGPLAGAGYVEKRLITAFDPRGINVGVISKLPIKNYVSHLGERNPTGAYTWSRDCTEVHVVKGGRKIIWLNNHLIAQSGSESDTRRTYQAQAVRDIADELAAELTDALIGVGGDFNDEPDSPTLDPLLGDGVYADLGAQVSDGDTFGSDRLDYLLVHSRASSWVTSVRVDRSSGVSTSDHRPVVANLSFPGCQ